MFKRMHSWLRCGALVGTLVGIGCAHGVNYPSLFGPRYAGGELAPDDPDTLPRTLRVVTFNTRFAAELDSILALMQGTPALDRPDIVALQEVDAAATARIAKELGMQYVYYPATRHPKYSRDFGNAVLARWPIVADRKLVLPHLGRWRQTERVVTAATVLFGDTPIRVYSTHLGMLTEIGPNSKRDQARAIIADAKEHAHVVVLGDMNSHGIGKTFRRAGYAWPTENNPRTIQLWNWDHVFLKGMALSERGATGVIDTRGASDHRAVWATITSPAAAGVASP
jgi:endonuclease/exonuclease/phosphatase family metal-dependent hydrolase